MSLGSLPPLLENDPVLGNQAVLASLVGGVGASLAVPEPAQAFVVAGMAHMTERHPIVVATPTSTAAERLAHDLRGFLSPDEVDAFPAWETLPLERVSPSVETMGRRLRTMWRLRKGTGAGGPAPRVLVAPVKALIQRLGPHVEEAEPTIVRPGQQIDSDHLLHDLVRAGYRREYQVEHRGEVAVRGSIVDVFPSTAGDPVRIDLWGDEVDRLTEFSVTDQRSTDDLACVEIFACRELLPTSEVRERAARLVATEPWGRSQWEKLAEGLFFDGMESWLPWLTEGEHLLFDLVGSQAQVFLVEPRRMHDRAAELLEEEAALASTLAGTWGVGDRPLPRLHLPYDRLLAHTKAPVSTITSAPPNPGTRAVAATSWEPLMGDAARLAKHLSELTAGGYRAVICADGEGSGARMAGALREEGLVVTDHGSATAPGIHVPGIHVVVEPLEQGFVLPSAKLAVLAESDITGRRRAHRRARPRRSGSETFFDSLEVGDYVVHHHHGVARYGGMVKRTMGAPTGPAGPGGRAGPAGPGGRAGPAGPGGRAGPAGPGGRAERDYLLLEYRGGDKLYVPSDQIDAVRPYSGGEAPSLHKLGGTDWQKTKARVRAAARDIAQELVVLYRRRAATPGHAYGQDTPWQRELEEAFPYTETPDQARAIIEVKADMEEPVPMDRLVCGDVGFGKTEVAIRAAFKAVQDGKQAAVLVPTTLLAQQHFATFSERFAGYPVRVEVLSRFLTPAQARSVTQGLAQGAVDVVIGTHRMLSPDVKFNELGLLVVDEEHRFGVTHKEAIKKLRADVDVLTLTATPIPRTLEMSLTGVRDLTLLNTPPAERQPILTYVGEYDERAVAEAIRRELLREGQVFFVHNRVADIEHVAAELRDLVPEARIAVAHGQMDEGTLESAVLDFWAGEYDVLLCTTIIESGIDMPTVNTLVVDRADLLGLGQLHQLRGRVGRAGQRAYAYLFFPPHVSLSEEAYERLRTIGDHNELGSGFKIAMRDLEIRGAGNLLGADQSGHIAAVGYDLYVQMVSEAVAELKGEQPRQPAEIKLDLPVAAHLPPEYVGREDLRLEAYRRLATITNDEQVEDIRREWLDRFGPLPQVAEALLAVGRLRAACARTGIKEVTVARQTARLLPLSLKTSQTIRLRRLYPRAVYKPEAEQIVFPLEAGTSSGVAAVEAVLALIEVMVPGEITAGSVASSVS